MRFDPAWFVRRTIERRKIKADALAGMDPHEQRVHQGRRNFVIDNISAYVIVTICAGSYLAGLLQYAGVPDELNGLILAIPVLAGAFQIAGALVSQKLNSQKTFVVSGIAIQRFCLSVIFFYPLIFGPGLLASVMMVLTYAIGFLAGTTVGPSAGNWLVSLVPSGQRAKYFSYREKLSLLFVAAATVVASQFLDRFRAADMIVIGFASIGAFLMIFTVVDVIHVSRIYEPHSGIEKRRASLSDIAEPLKDATFRKVIVVLVLWQASVQLAVPFLGLYFIDNIGISYSMIGIVALIITVERALIVEIWGKLAERSTWENVLKLAILIFASSQFMLFFLNRNNFIWFYPLTQVVSGIAWSVLNIGFFNFQYQFIKPSRSTVYIGVCGAISGIAGFVSALAGSGILNAVGSGGIGRFDVSGHRILLLVSSFISIALFLYMHLNFRKIRSPEEKELS
ncbi:MAG: MFS transporter [Eubacteriales bacterium]|nr:MFS transporter [Eubacteriales bacterium]MDD4717193.1 MFS transporter [Eubacteriales bacterium]